MIRKLLLPLVAVALLGGCVSYGYSNRHGTGDYYYGAPSVDYRYYSPYYYGSPYSYYSPYYSPYSYYGGHYSYYSGPYGDGYPYYYTYPYYGGGYHPHGRPRPSVDPTPDRNHSPWRDLDQLRRRSLTDQEPLYTGKPIPEHPRRTAPVEATAPRVQPRIEPRSQPRIETPSQPRSAPAPRRDSSALGGMVRRSRKSDPSNETTP